MNKIYLIIAVPFVNPRLRKVVVVSAAPVIWIEEKLFIATKLMNEKIYLQNIFSFI